MIISDSISQAELNNLTSIPLACAFALYLIIKNIKSPSATPAVTCYFKGSHIQNWRFTPLYRSFLGHRQIIYENHPELAHKFHIAILSTISPSQLLSAYAESRSIHKHFSTPHKHGLKTQFLTLLPTYVHTRKCIYFCYTVFFSLSPLRTPPNGSWWSWQHDGYPQHTIKINPLSNGHTNARTPLLFISEIQYRF